jgi:hypothetical protein
VSMQGQVADRDPVKDPLTDVEFDRASQGPV